MCRNWDRCIWCQRLLPTIEALAEVLDQEDEEPEITVATVDCTVETNLCTNVFGIRVGPCGRRQWPRGGVPTGSRISNLDADDPLHERLFV